MEKTIMIDIGAPPEYMADEVMMAEQADEEMFEAMAPKGDFTQRGLSSIVRATNKMLPLFGQTPDYPDVPDTNMLPTDFTRILAMFAAAVEEAIEDDILSPEMAIDLSTVRDDSGLLTVAGKIDMLRQDKDFKRYLAEEVPNEDKMEMSDDMDKDFEPHMMYDPESGKSEKANTQEDHERLSAMGYVHDDEMSEEDEDKFFMGRM
tara:strand:- start:607 stop:1221 length:615 start_codon:yes stop_codon:yes gene_type:complete